MGSVIEFCTPRRRRRAAGSAAGRQPGATVVTCCHCGEPHPIVRLQGGEQRCVTAFFDGSQLVLPQPRLPARLAGASERRSEQPRECSPCGRRCRAPSARNARPATPRRSAVTASARIAGPPAPSVSFLHDAPSTVARPVLPCSCSCVRPTTAAAAHHRGQRRGRVKVAPDLAIVSFAVETTAPTAGAAVAENAKKSTALVDAIKRSSAPRTRWRRRHTRCPGVRAARPGEPGAAAHHRLHRQQPGAGRAARREGGRQADRRRDHGAAPTASTGSSSRSRNAPRRSRARCSAPARTPSARPRRRRRRSASSWGASRRRPPRRPDRHARAFARARHGGDGRGAAAAGRSQRCHGERHAAGHVRDRVGRREEGIEWRPGCSAPRRSWCARRC